MKCLLIGVAAAALVVSGAASAQGNSRGQGNEKAEQARSGGAQGNRGGGPSMRGAAGAERGNQNPGRGNENPGRGAGNAERAQGNASQVAGPPGRGNAGAGSPGRGNAPDTMRGPANPGRPAQAARQDAGPGWDRGNVGRRDGRVLDDGRRIFEVREQQRWWVDDERRGLIAGCPPGLARKQNGCRPPGLARQQDARYAYRNYDPAWWGLGGLGLGDGRYFYDDGYLLQFRGDRLVGHVPLLGGALAVGQPWPDYYAPRPVPAYYSDYYGLGPANGYRYADDVLYRVDPATSAITSIAALLTGNDIRIGQPMPAGYDVYNVPYPYRAQYADGPDAWYRYSDGYVYQVDPGTRLVAAAIELLAS